MALKGTSRGNATTLVPTLIGEGAESQKKFKAKIKLGTKRVGKWEKKQFKNPARTDGVQFFRWQKSKKLEDQVYRFAKRNRKLSIPKYTDAEYESYFKTALWTRAETEYLFEMCNNFDLRFIVISDRWRPPEGSIKETRTVEELKDRYYTIQRGLLPLRKVSEEDSSQSILLKHPYDPLREAERKRQEEESTNRTEEELAEEIEITGEIARIDATFKKHAEDALKYLRLIKKQQKYFANLRAERMAYQAAKDYDEKTKYSKRSSSNATATSSSAMDVDAPAAGSTTLATPFSAANSAGSASAATSMPPPSSSSPAPSLSTLSASGANLSSLSGAQKLSRRHPAAYSRTHSKAYTASLVPQLNQPKYTALYMKVMPELGIDAVPKGSFVIVSAVTELRCDLLLLHEMQRLVAEKSYELEVLKRVHKDLQERVKNAPSSSASSSAGNATSAPVTRSNAMAVDN